MSNFDLSDVLEIENGSGDEESYFISLQRAINSGHGWKLQGSFGRAMMSAIESGHCMLGTEPAHDYWGNRIPSRSEVKPSTKGSREFVVANHDEAWAQMMENCNELEGTSPDR